MLRPILRLNDGYEHTSPELKDEVKELQEALINLGYDLEADGLFGCETEDVLKRFQRDRGLDDDGVAGIYTWSTLLNKRVVPDTNRIFPTTYPRESTVLKKQLSEVKKYKSVIKEAGLKYNIQPSIIAGIGSRESHWGLALKPHGCEGTGDTIKRKFPSAFRTGALPPDGGGYGRGLMQIDFDAHEFARSGKWRDPKENIFYGSRVLSGSYEFMKRKTPLAGLDLLRAAIAGYNCGPGNVLRAFRDGRDIDFYTFGRDYSKDVLNRSGWFQLWGWE